MIETPGDHFSILRQDPGDMDIIISRLKARLAKYGWTEKVVLGPQQGQKVTAQQAAELADYLREMGADEEAVERALMTLGAPVEERAEPTGSEAASASAVQQQQGERDLTIQVLNQGRLGAAEPPVFLVASGSGSFTSALDSVLGLNQRVFGVHLPRQHSAWASKDLGELAAVLVAAILKERPEGQLLLGAIGHTAALAYEMASRLARVSSSPYTISSSQISSLEKRMDPFCRPAGSPLPSSCGRIPRSLSCGTWRPSPSAQLIASSPSTVASCPSTST